MNVTVRQGAAFVGLYILMLAVLVRPQMNFTMQVNSYFLYSDYSATMMLTYRFDGNMALVAAPVSAGTVFALTQWNIQCENPNVRKGIIVGVVCTYILTLSVNFLANVLVLQDSLVRFDQCPRQAWFMYCHMAVAFIESMLADLQSLAMSRDVKRPQLTYRLR